MIDYLLAKLFFDRVVCLCYIYLSKMKIVSSSLTIYIGKEHVMTGKANKGLLREELLDSLTEKEIIGLVELLNRVRNFNRTRKKDALSYLMSFDAKTLFGVLHKELFGFWDSSAPAFYKVMENLDKMKEILNKISVKTVGFKTAYPQMYPQMPNNLYINNERTGNVFVTIHAWKRFCERCYAEPEKLEPRQIADRLKKSFARAKQVRLEKAYAVLRAINNKFISADYFLDQSMNCRFVIISRENKITLLTIERPRTR